MEARRGAKALSSLVILYLVVVVPKSIDIGSATAFSFPSNELKYFSFNASNDTSSLYKITLSVTAGTAFLYISNVGVPSEFLHCSKIEETSSTGYVYLSTTQLSSCGSQEVIIGIAGKGASMIEGSLTVSDVQDSYNCEYSIEPRTHTLVLLINTFSHTHTSDSWKGQCCWSVMHRNFCPVCVCL